MHGSSHSLFGLVEGLRLRGVEVVMAVPICWKQDDDFDNCAKKLDVRLYRIQLEHTRDNSGWTRRPWHFRTFLRNAKFMISRKIESYHSICTVIEREHPDVVHTNVGIIHEGYWAARKFKIPHVFHLREYQDKDFGWNILPSKRVFSMLLRQSAAVITITNDIRYHFYQHKNPNALTIYNGVFSINDASFILSKEKYFLCASRISHEKGLIDVITAFSDFHQTQPDYKLMIAGDGDKHYIETLKQTACSLGCMDDVCFVGFSQNVKSLMQHATALIVGSYNEGFGRMTAEAAFQGCLIIGRNTAGTKEILDCVGGYPFMSIDELRSNMNAIIKLSPEEYRQKAISAQKIAIENYSKEQYVEKVYNVYKSLLNNNTHNT